MDNQLEDLQEEGAIAWPFYREKSSKLQDSPELDKQELGRAFYRLAKLYYDKADINRAEKYFLQSFDCTVASTDYFPMLKILGFLIRIASEKLNDEDAQKYIQKCKILLDDIIALKVPLSAEYFYNMGLFKTYTGNFIQACENLNQACRMAREEKDNGILAKGLLALAISFYYNNNLTEASSHLEKLKTVLNTEKKDYLSGVMYYYKGKIYLTRGDYKQALECFEKSVVKFNKKGCWNLHGYLLLNKGMAYKKGGEYNKALLYYKDAVSCADRNVFRQLISYLEWEIDDVNDSNVDIYFDWLNRKVKERTQGIIDFKHRFVLLEIFYLLIKNPDKYFNKEQLAKSIWQNEYDPSIHDKLVYTSVSRLRKIIEPDTNEESRHKYIIRSKEGYSFNSKAKVRFCNGFLSNTEKPIANVELSLPV